MLHPFYGIRTCKVYPVPCASSNSLQYAVYMSQAHPSRPAPPRPAPAVNLNKHKAHYISQNYIFRLRQKIRIVTHI